MDDSFALRFESGERKGDLIPILGASGSWTIGRRPGNSLQILDASVSGKHAEFRVEDGNVVVKDLGSTNGTRVGGQRVIEAIVGLGDPVHIGNVRLTLVDNRTDAQPGPTSGGAPDGAPAPKVPASVPPPPASSAREGGTVMARTVASGTVMNAGQTAKAATAGLAPDTGPGVAAVSAERLARSKSRSLVGSIVIALLLVAGGATWYLLRSEGRQGARVRPVVAVPGNLLAAGYSFEADDDGWRSDDRATGGFFETPGARYSGEVGVEADLVAGEWAEFGSEWLGTSAGRTLTVRAWARGDGDLAAALGIELGSSASESGSEEDRDPSEAQPEPAPGPAFAWASVPEGSGWVELELGLNVPPGYDRARVVLRGDAFGDGTVAFDDVSLISTTGTPAPAAEIADIEVWALGLPVAQLLLNTLDAPLVTGLAASSPVLPPDGAEDASGGARRPGAFTLAPGEPGDTEIEVAIVGLPNSAAAVLALRAETVLANASIATIGEGGYRTHGASFEREHVESLLIGGGRDLVRIGFFEHVAVRGAGRGDGVRIEVALGALRSFEIQLDFGEERKHAEDIAHEARKAERSGELGHTLELWAELLDGFPFESGLVGEAETTRGNLIRDGMLEVRGIREEVERARFFQLADLFRQCRERADAIAERYAPSEVEDAAYEVVADLDLELSALASDSGADEIIRLESIAAGLEAAGSEKLAQQVRSYVEQRLRESED